MAKRKSAATVMVADRSGVMSKVEDRRFETEDWPICFNIEDKLADAWLRYFHAGCRKRGWSAGSVGQLAAQENSASITVKIGEAVQFERQGYFCLDPDAAPTKLVFNRTVGLRDTWAKVSAGG